MKRLLGTMLAALVLAGVLGACGGRGFRVTATFDDVGDLQPRHSVQVADVRVGEISGIKLTDDYQAHVSMRISNKVDIPADSVAILRTTSLLGEKFIEVRPRGNPTKGPFLEDGAVLEVTQEAPELEFVAQEAVEVLGAVNASDLATITKTGADAFGGRGEELRSLIDDLGTISETFASRSGSIARVIDNLDVTSRTLAAGSGELDALFGNLATTTSILSQNRQQTVDTLAQLSRLAAVQNSVLGRHRAAIERQIRQADAIVAEVAGHTDEVRSLVDMLHAFTVNIPRTIPGDFTQVYMWLVPALEPGTPLCQDPKACGA